MTCIKKDLIIKGAQTIFVSPERKNLVFTVKKADKAEEMFCELGWLVSMIKDKGVNCPKTIIFCNTLNDIAAIYNNLVLQLGSSDFIGMYHSNSYPSQKKRYVDQLKGQGSKRIIIASSALSMGVNFPDIKYVINWGPARNLLDQLQEAGRAGRNGETAHSIVYYHGRQLIHCKKDVKEFVRSQECYRVAAFSPFDRSVKPLLPKHNCCSYCKKSCGCSDNKCTVTFEFEKCTSQDPQKNQLVRPVTSHDKDVLKDALSELALSMTNEQLSVFDNAVTHGFLCELIEDIVNGCHSIFSVDILSKYPVFNREHASSILEIINEIFDDIPEEQLLQESCSNFIEDLSVQCLSLADMETQLMEFM